MALQGTLTKASGKYTQVVRPGSMVGFVYANEYAASVFCEPEDDGGMVFFLSSRDTGLTIAQAVTELAGIYKGIEIEPDQPFKTPLMIGHVAVGELEVCHLLPEMN